MRHKPLLFLAGAAGVLAGMWWVMEPAVSAPAELVARGEAAAEFTLTMRNGQVDGPGRLMVWQGEPVSITVVSDFCDAAHLHGYELHMELTGGEPGAFDFTAEHSGRFMLEMHGNEQQIATLEVYPRR
jgi:hypothetical protein